MGKLKNKLVYLCSGVILIIILMFVVFTFQNKTFKISAVNYVVSDQSSLILALSDADSIIDIVVDDDFILDTKITIPFGKTVTITSDYSRRVIYRDGFYYGDLFVVKGKLVLYDIAIDGNGYVVSSAGGSLILVDGGVFEMNTGALLFHNKSTTGGAAVNVKSGSVFTMNDGAIANCQDDYFGGAVFNNGTTNILGGDLANNYSDISGGAICNLGNLVVRNANFSFNSANYDGGAIYNYSGSCEIENSFFEENTAEYGGALHFGDATSLASVEGCYIFRNEAILGGGIYSVADISIENSHISYNNSTLSGGGVYLCGSYSFIEHTFFEMNITGQRGGGVYISSNNFDLDYCSFYHNESNEYGGGIFVDDSLGYGSIFNCDFTYNFALLDGGGLFNTKNATTIASSFFEENKADRNGGGIYTDRILSIYSYTIIQDSHAVYGGGLYIGGGIVLLNHAFIHDNEASYGAGIFLSSGTLEVEIASVNHNHASASGAGIYALNGIINIHDNLYMDYNVSGGSGGAIYLAFGVTLKIIGILEAKSNTALNTGGGIYATNYGSLNLTMTGKLFFSNNVASSLMTPPTSIPPSVHSWLGLVMSISPSLVGSTSLTVFNGYDINYISDPLYILDYDITGFEYLCECCDFGPRYIAENESYYTECGCLIPLLDGIKFVGWFDPISTNTFLPNEEYFMPNHNLTLYAMWDYVEYTITYFDLRGADNSSNPTSYIMSDSILLNPLDDILNFRFLGWFDLFTDNLVTLIDGSDLDNRILIAKWTSVVFTITYDPNGALGTPPIDSNNYFLNDTTAVCGMGELVTPFHKLFSGWFDGSTIYYPGDQIKITGNIILTPVWVNEPEFMLYYHDSFGTAVYVGSFYENENISIPYDFFFKTNYVLLGYCDVPYTFTVKIEEGDHFLMPHYDLHWYAVWELIQFSISYDSEIAVLGTIPTDNSSYLFGDYVTLLGIDSMKAPANMHFAGWMSVFGVFQPGDKVLVNGNMTFTAKWEFNDTYCVYYMSGIYLILDVNLYYEGDTVIVFDSNIFENEGYTFIGWNTMPLGNGVFVGNTLTMPNRDIVLYAIWVPILYTITYLTNGGEGEIYAQTNLMINETFNAAYCTFTHPEGLVFAGWNTMADGSGDTYLEGQRVIVTGNTILYAMWKEPIIITIVEVDYFFWIVLSLMIIIGAELFLAILLTKNKTKKDHEAAKALKQEGAK